MTFGTESASTEKLAARLGLAPIPHEGPLFVRTYESAEPYGALPPRYTGPRLGYNAIYALITEEKFSALHRLATDEIWHFYGGAALELLLLHPGGRSEIVVLGADVLGGQHPQFRVPRGVWQGARLLAAQPGAHALVGNTLAPAWHEADYEPGYRAELIAAYPDRAGLITALTRDDSIHRPVSNAAADVGHTAAAAANPSRQHYDSLLGPRYAWMTGDFSALVARAETELTAAGLGANTFAASTAIGVARALDLGAGRGQHALALARCGWAVTALEPCAPLRDELVAQFAAEGRRVEAAATSILEWVADLASVAAPASGTAPWHAILCLGDTLCHLPDLGAVARVLDTAAQRLAPGGRLVLTFRDYSDPAATGTVRTIPVKSDSARILTCVLHTGPTHVEVHDLFHERSGETWTLHASRYAKVRIEPAWVRVRLTAAGLAVETFVAASGMIGIVGVRAC